VSTLADLRPGDLAFGPIHGAAGAFVGAAQLALATVEPGLIWRQGPSEWFRKRHCGVITRAEGAGLEYFSGPSRPKMVQAMPGGAEEIELTPETHWTSEWTFIRPSYVHPEVGYAVADAARGYVGTPYDFATYAAIPPYRAGLRTARIKSIISGTDTMMCSRLLDASLADAGYHLFDDGRLPGNVTPSEAYRRLRELPHSVLLPGTSGWRMDRSDMN
jgi:hypothetical protein